ncbi:MAG: flagellar basal body-associated FliL family protein [Planctomycetes bacterium]|nr:flagellar basal body-associated FliL family protein [Planctomycetota bacterium]
MTRCEWKGLRLGVMLPILAGLADCAGARDLAIAAGYDTQSTVPVARRFDERHEEWMRTFIESAVQLSEKYAQLMAQSAGLHATNQELSKENERLRLKVVALRRELKQTQSSALQEENEDADDLEVLNTKAKEADTWVFDVPPAVANLMDPGARRYLRVGFKLEMSGQFDAAGGEAYMTKNMHKINNWIMIYFSNLTVRELQGEKNLNRVLMQIKDGLNELLFPDVRPLVVKALFSERAIQ